MSGFPNKNVDLSPGQLFRVFSWLNILLEKKKEIAHKNLGVWCSGAYVCACLGANKI